MRTKSRLLTATVVLLGSLLAFSAQAANIVIQNNDGAGEGFNDPTPAAPVGGNYGTTLGQQRLIAFTYAANIWAACLQSTPTITVRAQMDPLACNATSAVLGSAGAASVWRDFTGAPLAATWYPAALANALFGSDLDPTTAEINASFNSNLGNPGCLTGTFWYFGLDGNPPVNTIDFVSVVTHEIGHGVGFQTFVSQTGARLAGFNDDYMVFLENHGAAPPGYPAMSDAQRAAGNIADPNLHWTGGLVTAKGTAILSAGISGGHVRMHGPNPYQGGSSVSHWSTALTPNELMEPFYTGANHEPGLAWTLLDEIGWTLQTKITTGCNASTLNLISPTGVPNTAGGAAESFHDRGVFVTALKDFTLCSVGVEARLIPGENITASVYAATGTTRGALLATFTTKVEFENNRTHYIPLSYTLEDCKEYDIVVHWDHVTSFPWWDENVITEPYDVGGTIRVRDGEFDGLAGNTALLHFTLQGSSPTAENQSDVVVTHNCSSGFGLQHGAFITAKKTQTICKLGVGVDFTTAPATLRAYVYNAAGNVRGSLVGEGVALVPVTGALEISVPINAVLKEGQQYDIGFQFGGDATRVCHLENFPWEFGDMWTFDALESDGLVSGFAPAVPAFEITWSTGPGLTPLDINAPWLGAPDGTSTLPTAFGKYVKALHAQELSGLGFYADLAPGSTMTANVYDATGTTRGALVSTGNITTGPAGLRWHDIPVAATLVSGQDYDLEIDWSATTPNSFPYWIAVGAQQPYNAYGLLSIVVGEFGGAPDGATECVQFRVYACATGTLTATGPTPTPKFVLHDAYPNPFSGTATLAYDLDEGARVSVQVYDVAGRKVADVMKAKSLPAGSGELSIDAGKLPSGVYFVKLSTPTKSVTRKITILR